MTRNGILLALALVLAVIAGFTIMENQAPKSKPMAATKVARTAPQGPGPNGSPKAAFESLAPPPMPDYAQTSSWAALPTMNDSADLVPEGNPLPDAQATAAVDVFYIHPTTFRSTTAWVQDINDKATNDWTDMSVIARQAGIFNACCKIYAPRYRQAALGAVESPDGMKAFAFAYQDVKRAFAYYLDHYNNGRPFILVGHSQGAFHLINLLEEVVDQSALHEHLVAAYVIGIGVPMGTFGRQLKNITACAHPDDTGCVLSWNSYGRTGDPSATLQRSARRYVERFKTEEGKEQMCVNPLTFDLSMPDAPASANLGALPGIAMDGPLPAVKPGLIGATCRDGALFADIPTDPDFVLNILPGEVLHYHDMDLYFQNIRANAIQRTQAWLRASTHLIRGLAFVALLIAARAEAGTPLRPLQHDAAEAAVRAGAASADRDAQHQAALDTLGALFRAEDLLRKARSGGPDDKALAAAMDALARSKAAYDAAMGRERAAVIVAVQADAAARAARQALTDALTAWSEEGDALEKAAARAASGEVVRTAREHTACLDQDCGPISPREHAALVLMGAVGPNFDPKDWPRDAAQDMSVLPASAVEAFRLRNLRAAAADVAKRAEDANGAASAALSRLNAALPGRESRLQALLDAYFRPPNGTRAKDAVTANADALLADDTTEPLAEGYRSAAATAATAKAPKSAADARLEAAIARFGDMGRAVRRAATMAARGNILQAAGKGVAACHDGQCTPTAGIEAAAFVVIGAAAPGLEKNFAGVLAPTPDGHWAFKLP